MRFLVDVLDQDLQVHSKAVEKHDFEGNQAVSAIKENYKEGIDVPRVKNLVKQVAEVNEPVMLVDNLLEINNETFFKVTQVVFEYGENWDDHTQNQDDLDPLDILVLFAIFLVSLYLLLVLLSEQLFVVLFTRCC